MRITSRWRPIWPRTELITSTRINLSPFTKDFREGEQLSELRNQFLALLSVGLHIDLKESMPFCRAGS